MMLPQQIVSIFLMLFLQIGFGHSNLLIDLENVRDFAEEAAKGLGLTKLSHYFVDYAHLNGFLVIHEDQYEEIGAEEAAQIEADKKRMLHLRGSAAAGDLVKKVKRSTKMLKEVDKKALSNHLTMTTSSTLLPSPYPRELFELAKKVQPLMADLHFRASFDVDFIRQCTEHTAKSDSLIAGMLNIMNKVEEAGRRNPITLIIQRSDYLTAEEVDSSNGKRKIELKQIEVTNSIGKGQGDGHLVSKIHERMLEKVRHTRSGQIPLWLHNAHVEENQVVEKQAKALYSAWKLFARKYAAPRALILLLSVPKRKSYCHFEQTLWQMFQLEDFAWAEGRQPQVEFLTFDEMTKKLSLGSDMHLYYQAEEGGEKKMVAIAYFQDGFTPDHFSTPEQWDTRELMEMSTAIMSPSVYMHLMGSKTVQEQLAKDGAIEKYYSGHPEMADALAKLRGTFIQMWALGPGDEQIVNEAIGAPNSYVLKANTDGGKGNFFNEKMAEMLTKLKGNEEERAKYILQKRIRPFRIKNAIIPQPPAAESSIKFAEMDTEVSIFGSFLGITKVKKNGQLRHDIPFNDYDGYFIRTKLSTNVQCNMSMGQGGTDSLVLFPLNKF